MFEPFYSAFIYLDRSTLPFSLPDDLDNQPAKGRNRGRLQRRESVKLVGERASALLVVAFLGQNSTAHYLGGKLCDCYVKLNFIESLPCQ